MKKTWGILGLLVVVCVATALVNERFVSGVNIENLVRRSSLFGLLSIGAAFVIITGGIDLSIGSVIALVGVMLPWLLVQHDWHPALAVPFVLGVAALIGLVHGLLITGLRLQPFLVTLCGLLLYRGIARGLTGDQPQGFGTQFEGMKVLATGRFEVAGFGVPAPSLILLTVAVVAGLFLTRTIWGRYLFAIGNNEEAARYSGIATRRMTVFAYVACSTLAGLGGLLFVFDVNSAQPSDFGNFYELYAIAGAVLGGCALRGGEGTILGVVIGASIMQVLRNSIRLIDAIPNQLEFAVIGAVILAGVVVDELVKRAAERRRLRRHDAR